MMGMSEARQKQLEIEETAEWVLQNGTSRVALQVPDHMLDEAASISHHLEQRLREKGWEREGNKPQVFIMADTIDGSCHVDEITAQHLTADCVVSLLNHSERTSERGGRPPRPSLLALPSTRESPAPSPARR